MGMPNAAQLEIPNDGAGNAIVGVGAEVQASDLVAGYDYIRDGGAAFTANLEGSVNRRNWTTVVALAASGQGSVGSHYNFLRVKVSAPGALGATTELWYHGKS